MFYSLVQSLNDSVCIINTSTHHLSLALIQNRFKVGSTFGLIQSLVHNQVSASVSCKYNEISGNRFGIDCCAGATREIKFHFRSSLPQNFAVSSIFVGTSRSATELSELRELVSSRKSSLEIYLRSSKRNAP